MNAKKCDRCGKLFEYTNLGLDRNAFVFIQRKIIDVAGIILHQENFDLCVECSKAFTEFMKGVHPNDTDQRSGNP